ncbi:MULTISPECIES: helix-turn-helix domain-containing protein [Bacillus cereus group]|uniref:helix-turn-helix domain-containing protein n=1 Tax=Bacillus cereus group TaxID=86661 RepID=UPI000B44B7AC|nr:MULTISPECIES: helix-turn-helix domain-containing protein [Bacillus cereus group]KAA0771802.1 XRE family transcriptional regulator [Bacillus sp. BB51/4]OTW85395.1 transcriptional regulator [Bacillus thuringiensis serovar cameroun]PEO31445.1 transcriptional regulator [Bacillus toyonensis]
MTIMFYIDLESLCKQHDKTLTRLSEESGVTRATLSRVKATGSGTLETISAIATALKIEDPERIIRVMKK